MAFRTRSAGTPPLRAISTPQCMWSSSRIECASGLMLIMQPKSSAAWCHRQSRSRRQGCVDLHRDAMAGAGAQNLLDVYVIAWPALKLTARHVTEDGGVRIANGLEQA